jgi:putative ABC transport system permease protein
VLAQFREGIAIATDQLRSNKLRSALTILGVVIGVTTVMAMSSIVVGIQNQVFNAINTAAPNTFYVMRYFASTPVDPQNPPYEVRIRPPIRESDADAIARVAEISYASLWVQVLARIEYGEARTQRMELWGADERYMDLTGGTLIKGRLFSRAEINAGSPVFVIDAGTADRIFGEIDPIGKYIRVGGRPLQVIGVLQPPENMWAPPGQERGGIMPFRYARSAYTVDEVNGLIVAVRAREDVSVERAQDLAMIALRQARGLRPGMPNTFDILTQDQLLSLVTQLTGAFFAVMIALSGVALMVGGIGVMAIMMVSVTDRTTEIGLRKALGARRAEILFQFLVEAATLTLLGGIIGIAFGLLAGEVIKRVLDIQANVPLWSAGVAAAVSVAIGLVFGLIPANRAARMDPVEALRHE